jgi:hypothetical protein
MEATPAASRPAAGRLAALPWPALALLPALTTPVLAAPAAVTTTTVPSYRIEAVTTSGMGAMGMGSAAMMRMMLGGRPAMGTTTNRSLELRLESPQVVANPTAEHRIPAALGMGASLPLRSLTLEKGERPTWKEPELVEGKGRMLLFRGCAESAGADQPEIVSLQGLAAEQKRAALAGLAALAAMPQAVDASGTTGSWPDASAPPPVPPGGSLVGTHTVVSTYAPEISFQVASSHDFLAPVVLLTSAAGPGGSQGLRWQVVPTALGYQASAVGQGRQEGDIVIWTSSTAPRNDSWVPGDLRAPEAARLIQRQVLLPPERTSCSISAQAMAAVQGMAMVTVTAYGDTLMLNAPQGTAPWQLSLERRSSATRPVGEGAEMLEGGGSSESEPRPGKQRGFNPFSLF